MDYKNYYGVMMMMETPEPMPSGKDMYKEGGLKCKGISSMERMLDQEAKTNYKKSSSDASQD